MLRRPLRVGGSRPRPQWSNLKREEVPILALAVVALVVGVFIGAVGIGGVALPPVLAWFAGFDPHTAAGTSVWAFSFTGIVGCVMYARHSSMSWRLVRGLSFGAVPAAILGAWVNGLVPDAYAMLPLAVLVMAVGVHRLWSYARTPSYGPVPCDTADMRWPVMIMPGFVVGFASALTGTGGPVFLVPALLVLHVPVLSAIAVSQVVQLPLVIAAVLGYAQQGAIDYGTGSLIGVFGGGSSCWCAHRDAVARSRARLDSGLRARWLWPRAPGDHDLDPDRLARGASAAAGSHSRAASNEPSAEVWRNDSSREPPAVLITDQYCPLCVKINCSRR